MSGSNICSKLGGNKLLARFTRTFLLTFLAVMPSLMAIADEHVRALRVAVSTRPPGLGNPYSSMPIGAINPNHVLYDALTLIGDKGVVLPSLALSWEPEAGASWIFRLRPDVVFSNGEPFTADTVVSVIEYLRSENAARYPVAIETAVINYAEAVDPLTVRITTTKPDALLPKRMSFVFMIPMKYWNEVGVDGFGLNPAGSGPFKVKDWGQTTGTYIFERNPSSWRTSEYFDELHFTGVVDVVSRAQTLISDQVDLSFKLSLDLLVDLKSQGYQTLARQTYSIGAWAFRQIDPDSPLADTRVRRALNLAIDRKKIAETILSGVTSPVSQVATSDVYGFNPNLPLFPYDPAAARALLVEAGYGTGFKLDAIVRSDPSVPEQILIGQVVAQNLAEIGLDVKLNQIPGQRWLGHYFSGDWGGAHILKTSFNNTIHGDVIRSIETASCLKAGAFYCKEEMLPLIEASNREFDPAIRQKMLQELVAALHNDPPAIYLFPYFDTLAYSPMLDELPMTGARINLEGIGMKQ